MSSEPTQHPDLSCACGKVQLRVLRDPILVAECHCTSCRTAAVQLEALSPAHKLTEPNGGTQFVLYRKDRIRFASGTEYLKEHRVTPASKTRRVVATCCNTPVFLEFENGHWLSLYSRLWPEGTRPRIELRTMTSDRTDPTALPADVPNAKTQSFSFFAKLLGAWVAMGFRAPKLQLGHEPLTRAAS